MQDCTMANLIDALALWMLQLHLVIKRLFFEKAADVFRAFQEEFVQELILHNGTQSISGACSWQLIYMA